jgi:16S rRNA G966 N2-methylase RsmD
MKRMLPEEVVVGRGDPVYMAHAYLTKVPVPAIIPFVKAYTKPGDLVIDPFAGSGMTGVAAASVGRRARLSDISVLGQHIGRNYVNLVDPTELRRTADKVIAAARAALGDLYRVTCTGCGEDGQLAKTVWSTVVECGGCNAAVNYYESMEAADWAKPKMVCPHCAAPINARLPKVGESPVLDYVECACSSKQREQRAVPAPDVDLAEVRYPRVEIGEDRQMYKASALGRHGMTTIASFYSARNLAVLTTLHEQIQAVESEPIRQKLLFAFTASLTRASKRYQWSRQRPLNAANANYYVAPVFYEWNVFDLYRRKVEAAVRSDDWIRDQLGHGSLFSNDLHVAYEIGSATSIDLPDSSVDYVFTDPPFGSNLFYADMALFQEAWLDGFTNVFDEAVIDRGKRKVRGADRYEEMLTNALRECRRVLKPGGHVSMVFGNSSGAVWSLVERAVRAAGLVIDPDQIVILNKGQRSVKGLASGFEHVATLDLVLTMSSASKPQPAPVPAPEGEVEKLIRGFVASASGRTPSHLYLELLRVGLQQGWDLGTLDLRHVVALLRESDLEVDSATGRVVRNVA